MFSVTRVIYLKGYVYISQLESLCLNAVSFPLFCRSQPFVPRLGEQDLPKTLFLGLRVSEMCYYMKLFSWLLLSLIRIQC